MKIDDKMISYLEDLSNFTLSEPEKTKLKGDLTKIIESFECIKKVDAKGVSQSIHPFDEVNNLREDVVIPSMDRELLLKNAPKRDEAAFVAPKTVE